MAPLVTCAACLWRGTARSALERVAFNRVARALVAVGAAVALAGGVALVQRWAI